MATLVLSVLIFVILPEARAAGQSCCTAPNYRYNSTYNDCARVNCTGLCTSVPTNCDSTRNETCNGTICIVSALTLTPTPTSAFGPTVTAYPTLAITGAATAIPPYNPCKNDGTGQCQTCRDANKTWTAIGCLENDPPALVGHLIGIGGGLAGGVAFLMMLFGAAQLVLSQGVPEKIQQAREIITSAVIGVVFIFLSILILKLIGVQILGIPGWS